MIAETDGATPDDAGDEAAPARAAPARRGGDRGGWIWLALVVIAVGLFFLRVSAPWPVERLQALGFDALQGVGPVSALERPAPVVVGVGDRSIAEIGPWPWPRDRLAGVVEAATQAGAEVVVLNLLLEAPDVLDPDRPRQEGGPGDGGPGDGGLRQAPEPPPSDAALAEALRKVRSALATSVTDRPASSESRGPFALTMVGAPAERTPAYEGVAAAAQPIRAGATTEGAANLTPDADAVLRRAPTVFFAGGVAHPSLAVAAVAAMGRSGTVIARESGVAAVVVGGRRVRTDAAGRVFLDFAGGAARVGRVEASDLVGEGGGSDRSPGGAETADAASEAARRAVAGRVAVIGVDAAGLAPAFSAAHGEVISGAEVVAVAIDALISGATLSRPRALVLAEHAAFLAVALALATAWARLSRLAAAGATLACVLAWLAAAAIVRVAPALVVDVAAPIGLWIALAGCGALLASLRRGRSAEPGAG
ncbi:CHASE2 domain-containing protein [Rubrimonas cliftonensis]|uniref:Sensor domain CHASE2-containing protein n=1 Tax=Rubrimonas cliftonensis TaxID=89524 RepID=A0A1H3YUX6_9RHOB|nr:CHASE2 domain-containing protein [Rubrimonas cliftonensis]SEA15365.1 sensor domain CHASE2-containing protein [Rubrimonas cliftonensis]